MDAQIRNTGRGFKTLAGNRVKEQGAVWERAGSRKATREHRRDSFAEM